MKIFMQKAFMITFFLIAMTLSGCAGQEEQSKNKEGENTMSDVSNPREDMDILKKWFPSVVGMESALWEAGALGLDEHENVPGPGVFYAKGFIFIEKEQIDEWFRTYQFEGEEISVRSEYWDESDYKDVKWFFSWDFNDDYKPGYYQGKLYLSEIGIWFDVVK